MVSLGLVGEVFEVRTQVDRDLTTVSRVDRRSGLIKNLRRHNRQPPEGAGTSGLTTPQAATGGGCPVRLRCSLSDTAPRAGGHRTRSPSKRPPHISDPPHEGCTEGGGSGEEEGAPGPPRPTKHNRI
jgi:hypothetical protein